MPGPIKIRSMTQRELMEEFANDEGLDEETRKRAKQEVARLRKEEQRGKDRG